MKYTSDFIFCDFAFFKATTIDCLIASSPQLKIPKNESEILAGDVTATARRCAA